MKRELIQPSARLRLGTAFMHILGLNLVLIVATVLATIITRALVPPAPAPGHQWIFLKNLLLPVLLVLVYKWAVVRLESRDPREVSPERAVSLLLLGSVLGIGIIGVYVLALRVSGAAHFSESTSTFGIFAILNELMVPWLTAVGEELLFRLILFRIAEEAVGTAPAALISAALFDLSHVQNPGASPTSLVFLAAGMGILQAFAFAATRSLWFPVGLHMGWNFAEGFLFGLPNSGQPDPLQVVHTWVSGPTLVTGGAFGPEGSYVLFAITVGVIAVLVWLTFRSNQWHSIRRKEAFAVPIS